MPVDRALDLLLIDDVHVRIPEDGPWYAVVGIAGNVRAKIATDEFQD